MKYYLETAIRAAQMAGEYLLARRSVAVDEVLERDVKLTNDKESERLVISVLEKTGISILTEESGLIKGEKDSTLRWIVDPLDGSINYLRGIDELTCISIALFDGDSPLMGVIYRYAAGEMFTGIVGDGAWLNDTPVRTSGMTKVKDAVLATGLTASRDYSDEALMGLLSAMRRFKKVRLLGAAAIMGVFVACGRVDVYIEEDIRLWDIAAAMAIIIAAGGVAQFTYKTDKDNYLVDFQSFATTILEGEYICAG